MADDSGAAAPPVRLVHGRLIDSVADHDNGADAPQQPAAVGPPSASAAARPPPAAVGPYDASAVAQLLATLHAEASVALATSATVETRVAALKHECISGDPVRGLAGLALLYAAAGQQSDAATAALALLMMPEIAPQARVEAGCRLVSMLDMATAPPVLTKLVVHADALLAAGARVSPGAAVSLVPFRLIASMHMESSGQLRQAALQLHAASTAVPWDDGIRLRIALLAIASEVRAGRSACCPAARSLTALHTSTAWVPWYVLGRCHLHDGDGYAALQALCAAIRCNPTGGESWAALGAFYRAIGQPHTAIAALTQCVQVTPRFPGGWAELAALYDGVGQHADAARASALAQQCTSTADALQYHVSILCDAALYGGSPPPIELQSVGSPSLEHEEAGGDMAAATAEDAASTGGVPLADTTLPLLPGDEAAARAQASQALLSLTALTNNDRRATHTAAGLVSPAQAARGSRTGSNALMTPERR